MAAPPPLPTRFPCWCRAVYSWGGEGKRDLGFIEGDLIECLNAGDGSWWTGRLYRDRRTVGSFPSNFVEVLPDSFRPTTRSVSPLPANNAPAPGVTGSAKSKSFRKPFEAYAKAPHYTTAKQPVTYIGGGKVPPKPEPSKPAPSTAIASASSTALTRKTRESIVERARTASPAVGVGRTNTTYGSPNTGANTNMAMVMRSSAVQQQKPASQPYASQSISPLSSSPLYQYNNSHQQQQQLLLQQQQQNNYARSASPAPLQGYPPVGGSPGVAAHSYPQRSVSPAPHTYASREGSPAVHSYNTHSRSRSQYSMAMGQSNSPAPQQYMQRGVSPSPMQPHQSYNPRSTSPAPPAPQQQANDYNYMQRSASPAPFSQYGNSMPQQHQQQYQHQHQHQRYQDHSRSPSPAPLHHHYSHSGSMQRSASPVPPHHYHSNSGGSMPRGVSPGPYHAYTNSSVQRSASPIPPSHYKIDHRGASPAPNIYNNYSRSASPAPLTSYQQQQDQYRRAASPAPLRQNSYDHRAVSPAPHRQNSYDQRAVSPAPYQHYNTRSASPAPPPPNHYSSYGGRSPSPNPAGREISYHQSDRRFRPYSPQPPQENQFQSQTNEISGPPPPPAPPPHRHMTRQGSAMSFGPGGDASRQVSNTSYVEKDLYRQGSYASYDNRPTNQLSRNGSYTSYLENQTQIPSQSQNPNTNQNPNQNQSQALVRAPAPPLANGRFRAYTVGSAAPAATATPPPQNNLTIQTARSTSPLPPPALTPSPLREAMDGVMEQLETLRMSRVMNGDEVDGGSPWCPEHYDMVSRKSRKEASSSTRPQTAMGLSSQDSGYETWGVASSTTNTQSQLDGDTAPIEKSPLPELSSYVERMEKSLEEMHQQVASTAPEEQPEEAEEVPEAIPRAPALERPKSSMSGLVQEEDDVPSIASSKKMHSRRSAYEMLNRTFTTKTTASTGAQSNATSSTSSSGRSLMSGVSAGAISATSAGSFERRRERAQSATGMRDSDLDRPDSPFTSVSYHSSHASNPALARPQSQLAWQDEAPGLGGLVQPKTPKRSIFKKLLDSAKTGVANRSSLAFSSDKNANRSPTRNSPTKPQHGTINSISLAGSTALAFGNRNSPFSRSAAREMNNKSVDWVQVRRDVNRSNSLSRIERNERMDRARMLDYPAINAVDELYASTHGDEAADGNPVETPMFVPGMNLNLVDKNTRFLANIPSNIDAGHLASGFVCRPYKSDVQRLRAIFTWVSEKICWTQAYEGPVDTVRTIEIKRGCAEEYATLVLEMCTAVGVACELVRGYLKTPGETVESSTLPRANHWWNAVIVDGEWRMIDTCLASPSNPQRVKYSSMGSSSADHFWFLTPPSEICWTHIPEHHGHQHFCQPVAHEVLLNLPCVTPTFFNSGVEMHDYNSALGRIQGMEMVQLKVNVPGDVEIVAEVEARSFSRGSDPNNHGKDNGSVNKRALTQAEWYGGVKRYTIKAVLPGDEGFGVLRVYAGKRGLMHSIKEIPHPLALSIPIVHTGENAPYDFVTRHPTPHAQRHDIYVVQPQCQRLALNNTFVFAVRQHPSSAYGSGSGPQSAMTPASNPGRTSPAPFHRPGSAMSMSASGSNASNSSGTVAGKKPAKLAIQTPGGKILRLMRKEDRKGISTSGGTRLSEEETSDGGTWETIIKCSETGTWRGLVLADRTARWCVFAEWTCL
ncbi:hypothetical protein TD95_002548 [Thielaviopsis punctulata]|uniref:SH3 domain-containing protein n=1 Tax=Thielaviopsis punctulata TaxID=72032 RepID=A0A0F4ZE25_9PEZI|nr:hypothetical protein TD95_002548 [Thielaviopsis punctulata]